MCGGGGAMELIGHFAGFPIWGDESVPRERWMVFTDDGVWLCDGVGWRRADQCKHGVHIKSFCAECWPQEVAALDRALNTDEDSP